MLKNLLNLFWFRNTTKEDKDMEEEKKETPKSKFEITDKAKEFVSNLYVSREKGFNDWCIFTHAWHESGGFQRVIGDYNFWGIKTPSNWQGKVCNVTTHEYINGKRTIVVARFLDWDKCSEAIDWYCNLIIRLYPSSYQKRNIPIGYFEGLVSGQYKYATDPKYVEKLVKLYETLSKDEGLIYLLKNI